MANWKHKLNLTDVFHNDEVTLTDKTNTIIRRIKKAPWYEEANYNEELEEILEELNDAAEDNDLHQWDSAWAAFYDIADADRIWVKTHG